MSEETSVKIYKKTRDLQTLTDTVGVAGFPWGQKHCRFYLK